MARWMAAASEVAGMALEEGDLLRIFVSMFLGVFIVSLIWSVSSDRHSAPPY